MSRNKMTVITLTMNPVLDKSTNADYIVPEKKTRCSQPTYEPGGGGINVSRAMKKLGGESVAYFLSGGDNGRKIQQLLQDEGVEFQATEIEDNTRENLMIFDNKTGNQYRFVMPGPEVDSKCWKSILKSIEDVSPKPNYLIASGSLPPGVPEDFYAKIASFAKKNDIRLVLDTSGPALQMALEEGVHMVKPNLREMAGMLGQRSGYRNGTGRSSKRIFEQRVLFGACYITRFERSHDGAAKCGGICCAAGNACCQCSGGRRFNGGRYNYRLYERILARTGRALRCSRRNRRSYDSRL